MEQVYEKVVRCAEELRRLSGGFVPQVGLVLGTGLNDFVEHQVQVQKIISYNEVAGFPTSTRRPKSWVSACRRASTCS